MSDPTGDWFSRYKFRQPLGQGGMGVTYLAEDKSRGNELCVVKQLILRDEEPSDDAESIRLFKREASVLSQLEHPGIVRLSDAHVTADGKYFLVMDYIPGQNLAQIIKKHGSFSTEASVEIGIQVCEILEYLHNQTPPILYRDLKPSNLMLTPEGQVVFVDFGIARSFAPKTNATKVVTTGYSPPEQYFGRPELRSDLYALGATLGELLTGIRPPPLSVSFPKQRNPNILDSLADLIQQLTAADPVDRPPSARSVRYELYRIYQEIHPEFIPPLDVPLQEEHATPIDLATVESVSKTRGRSRQVRPYTSSRSEKTAQDEDLSRSPRKTGPGSTDTNRSILWNGIHRVFDLFRF